MHSITMPDSALAIPQRRQSIPCTIPEVVRVGLLETMAVVVHVKKDGGRVEQDQDAQRQQEGDDDRVDYP